MNNISIIKDIFYASWSDFKKHVGILFILGIVHSLISGRLLCALQIEDNFSGLIVGLVGPLAFVILKSLLTAIIITLVMQHVLDIVYNRVSRCFVTKESILQAILVNFVFFYIEFSRETSQSISFFKLNHYVGIFQKLTKSPLGLSIYLLFMIFIVPLILAFTFRFMFISLFILEDKCSIYEAFNRSWNLSLGNFNVYLTSLILPFMLIVLTITIVLIESVIDTNIILILLYGFITALSLLFNVHLFKKLKEIETVE